MWNIHDSWAVYRHFSDSLDVRHLAIAWSMSYVEQTIKIPSKSQDSYIFNSSKVYPNIIDQHFIQPNWTKRTFHDVCDRCHGSYYNKISQNKLTNWQENIEQRFYSTILVSYVLSRSSFTSNTKQFSRTWRSGRHLETNVLMTLQHCG